MAIRTESFNYSPALFLQKFNGLIYTGKDWTFKATLTKSGKKTINFFYLRKINKWTEQGTDTSSIKKKVSSPSKSIFDIAKLLSFSIKAGYKVTAILMGDYKED